MPSASVQHNSGRNPSGLQRAVSEIEPRRQNDLSAADNCFEVWRPERNGGRVLCQLLGPTMPAVDANGCRKGIGHCCAVPETRQSVTPDNNEPFRRFMPRPE